MHQSHHIFLNAGSPVKAEQMFKRKKTSSSTVYDPRPKSAKLTVGDKMSKAYALMVNYVYDTKHDINLRYMFGKADLQTASVDHDYLTKPFTELWVEQSIKVFS